MTCAGLAMTRARIGSGAGIGSANCWLRCFRGIDTLTAMLLLAELHDVQRFPTARALVAYLGLVPGEYSSGKRHRRGPITKTGNTLARRLVVEAAWHYRHRPGVSRTFAQRRSGQPRVIALADKAQQRLWSGALDFASLAVRMLDGGGTRRRTYPN